MSFYGKWLEEKKEAQARAGDKVQAQAEGYQRALGGTSKDNEHPAEGFDGSRTDQRAYPQGATQYRTGNNNMPINNDIIMSYAVFKKNVLKHLEAFMPEGGKPGKYNGRGEYGHIVDIPGKSQREIIEAILRSDVVETAADFQKPQRYAHHLNSSQVVCYEFFRPLLVLKRGKLLVDDEKMQPVLRAMGVPETPFLGADAVFEKEFDDGEGTNFDFYLDSRDGKSHLYVEVKYTEQGFGTCEDNKSHRNKFRNIYLGQIANSICLNDEAKRMKSSNDFPTMKKYYQLFRNTLRVKGENDFFVCLYPKENSIAESHFVDFREKYVEPQMASHILNVHWEDLEDSMNDRFRDKYFGY